MIANISSPSRSSLMIPTEEERTYHLVSVGWWVRSASSPLILPPPPPYIWQVVHAPRTCIEFVVGYDLHVLVSLWPFITSGFWTFNSHTSQMHSQTIQYTWRESGLVLEVHHNKHFISELINQCTAFKCFLSPTFSPFTPPKCLP